MTKKILFIFNPHSGKGQIKNHLLDILDKFAKAEYDITVRPTQERLDAYNYIKNNGDKFDRIVVSGGDGTLNEAVNFNRGFTSEHRNSDVNLTCFIVNARNFTRKAFHRA